MADPDVTASGSAPEPPEQRGDHRARRRRLPGFVLFGIVAATLEMAIVLALLYC